jgi:hypothetical protein
MTNKGADKFWAMVENSSVMGGISDQEEAMRNGDRPGDRNEDPDVPPGVIYRMVGTGEFVQRRSPPIG